MAQLIGRIAEQKELEKYYKAENSSFLMVYGRRRVGKTFLIREYFKNTFDFAITAIPKTKVINTKDQLINFYLTLKRFGEQKIQMPKNWFEAFDMLQKMLENSANQGKKVVFFDELPWMDTPRSKFLPAFEHFWNDWASTRNDILLIVCGSATSWMINNILDNTGGLHNRLSSNILLSPFSLSECEMYFKANNFKWNRQQIAESYMIFGGVPYYMSLMDSAYSLAQNVDSLLFAENGKLRDEYDHLYKSLFVNSDNYMKIIEILSEKDKGLTKEEIIEASGIKDGGTLSKILRELQQCKFIDIQNSFGKKSNYCALYRIVDSFSLFYSKIISKREFNDEHFWTHNLNTPKYNTWKGLAFEELCMSHIYQIKKKLGISGVLTNHFWWRSIAKKSGAQIDLVLDRKDDVINLCEMKYSKGEYSISKSYEKELNNKIDTFISETETRKAIHLTLVTTYGIAHNEHSSIVTNEITLDDLFEQF